MADVATFESREAKINSDIDAEVDRIRGASPLVLPKPDAPLVRSYASKIERTYNVDRAKRDTDNAIDLLYIAYNTTPQEEGDVRVAISQLMNKLISAQQSSELVMKRAMNVANRTAKSLTDFLPDWLDIKAANDQAEIKGFVGKDLIALAKKIRDDALTIRDELLAIGATYDLIIQDLVAATSKSEKALSARLKQRAEIEKEINEANAKREQLESLVSDLKEEVAKYDKMARDYEARASTAEQRAFVMSIIRVGAQMISQAVPAIAMVAGGPAPMLASSALGALSGKAPSPQQPGTEGSDGTASSGGRSDGGKTAEVVQTRTKISEQKAEIKKAEDATTALKADIKALENEKSKIAAEAGEGAASSPKDATSAAAVQVAEYDKRIRPSRRRSKLRMWRAPSCRRP